MRPAVLSVALVSLAVSWPFAAPAARAQAPAIPDLVELDDGSMARGTIIENMVGDHVTLMLPTGETRRFEAAHVRHAGPTPVTPVPAPVVPPPPASTASALSTPGVPQPPAQSAPGTVRLRVRSRTPHVTLYRMSGTSEAMTAVPVATPYGTTILPAPLTMENFAPVCTAPCVAVLPRGTWMFGIGEGEGPARRGAHSLFTIEHDSDVDLLYVNRQTTRIWGIVLEIVGLLGYLVGIPLGVALPTNRSDRLIGALSAAAASTLFFSIGVGLAFLGDHADMTVRPPEAAAE